MLQDMIIPELQQPPSSLTTITFQLDDAPPYIAGEIENLLGSHFLKDCIINHAFPTGWPPCSPDLTPCDFCLCGYLRDKVYQGNIGNLAD